MRRVTQELEPEKLDCIRVRANDDERSDERYGLPRRSKPHTNPIPRM